MRLHWSSQVSVVQARALGPSREQESGVPQHSPATSAEQEAASATGRLHFMPGGQTMSGAQAITVEHAPSIATDMPREAATSRFQ